MRILVSAASLLATAGVFTLAVLSGCPPQSATPPLGIGVLARPVVDGFTSPVGLAVAPDGTRRLFIVDQIGQIILLNTQGVVNTTPFLDLRSRIVQLSPTYDERGLLGLAFHPDYATNGRFFVYYSAPRGADVPANFDSEVRLSEFRATPPTADTADPATEQILLRIAKPQYNHNGGQLAFGPDGYLYVSVGDGGGGNDEGLGHTPGLGNAQDQSTLLGKILRIDVDSGTQYAVPADNPFVNRSGARPEIWADGLRNPWRFSFDRAGGRLFVADAGQDLFEEVSIAGRGDNLGWRIREGERCFNPQEAGRPLEQCADTAADGRPLVAPILTYPHTDAAGLPLASVVIGGYVYRGSAIPALQGQYIFGEFSTTGARADGRIMAARENDDGTWIAGVIADGLHRFVLAFGEDADGELYVLTTENFGPVGNTGAMHRIEPAERP